MRAFVACVRPFAPAAAQRGGSIGTSGHGFPHISFAFCLTCVLLFWRALALVCLLRFVAPRESSRDSRVRSLGALGAMVDARRSERTMREP